MDQVGINMWHLVADFSRVDCESPVIADKFENNFERPLKAPT